MSSAARLMPNVSQRKKKGCTAYRESGTGEVVLLIHGVGMNADAWEPQIEELSRTHRVIALDMHGHGASDPPGTSVELNDYVLQAIRLLDELAIEQANIVGHSMGGLVAIGMGLGHPQHVLRLAALNAVYERPPEARSAVEARAKEILRSGNCRDIDLPIRRWLGDSETQLQHKVRSWLLSVEPDSYANAYRVFASGNRLFSGLLGLLPMPCLFATGSDDPNSTPQMSEMMAAATRRGRAVILPGQRHLMNLVDSVGTNRLLCNFLAEPC